MGGNPEWLDPGLATDSQSAVVVRNMFSGLVQLHPQTLEPRPDIAERWEVLERGTRYRFYLRESYWSDGHPLTAQDFLFSFKRVLNPETASRYAGMLYPILYGEQVHKRAFLVEGVRDVSDRALQGWAQAASKDLSLLRDAERGLAFFTPETEWSAQQRANALAALRARPLVGRRRAVRLTVPDDLGVRALSDHTLEIRLREPAPYFLAVLGFYTTMPVPRHVLSALKAAGHNEIDWTRPEHIVVNGPFVLREWAFRQHMVLQKNPRYWDADQVPLRRIRLLMVESHNTALNMYKAGELDDIGSSTQVPVEFGERLSHYRDFRRFPFLSVYVYWLNARRPGLDDVRVRRALSLSIDREALVKHVLRGGQRPSADLVPDGLAGYEGLNLPQFDPARARALLREAGYGPEHPLPELTVRYNTAEDHKLVAETVQQMWRKHLGIDVQIENQEWRVFLKSLDIYDFDVARLGWIADYPDPYTFLELLMGGNGNNHSAWADPAYDRLLRRANAEYDPARRLSLLRQAEALGMAAQPLIPLYVYTRSELVKPFVRNAYVNAQEADWFKYIRIDQRYYDGVPDPLPDEPPRLPEPVVATPEASTPDQRALDGGVPAQHAREVRP